MSKATLDDLQQLVKSIEEEGSAGSLDEDVIYKLAQLTIEYKTKDEGEPGYIMDNPYVFPVEKQGFIEAARENIDGFLSTERTLSKEEKARAARWKQVGRHEMLVYYPRDAKEGERYADNTMNRGWLFFNNVKELLSRFLMTVHVEDGRIMNWRNMCIGITSLNKNDTHMPLLDYDGKNIKTRVKKDIKHLQKEFGLGDATIYTTGKGLHIYFFSDEVSLQVYREILNSVGCCEGFKKSFSRKKYTVLRVSAKYTKFDILPYKVILSPNKKSSRPGIKAVIVKELLRMGNECGTHICSLYPQWAYYEEDETPWKLPVQKKPGRKVRKVSKEEYIKRKAQKVKNHGAAYGLNEKKYSHPGKVMNTYTWTSNTTSTTGSTTTGNW